MYAFIFATLPSWCVRYDHRSWVYSIYIVFCQWFAKRFSPNQQFIEMGLIVYILYAWQFFLLHLHLSLPLSLFLSFHFFFENNTIRLDFLWEAERLNKKDKEDVSCFWTRERERRNFKFMHRIEYNYAAGCGIFSFILFSCSFFYSFGFFSHSV